MLPASIQQQQQQHVRLPVPACQTTGIMQQRDRQETGCGWGATATTAAATAGGGSSNRLLILLHGEKTGDERVREAVRRLRAEGHQVRAGAAVQGMQYSTVRFGASRIRSQVARSCVIDNASCPHMSHQHLLSLAALSPHTEQPWITQLVTPQPHPNHRSACA